MDGPSHAIVASELVIQRNVERVKQNERKTPTSRFARKSDSANGCFGDSPKIANNGMNALAQQLLSARLPELKVPVFDGEPTQWLEFWEAFQSSVDQKPLSDAEKLAYLKGYLDGEAKKAIEGYTSGRFYQDAVETLQVQFGKTDSIVRSFKKKLNGIKPPESSYKSLRHFVNDVNCICRQLKTLGFDPNGNDSIEDMIYEKLPVARPKVYG
uniref:Uncharacterized protein n=1 Tax=Panagrolaimus superbus TaxID=310955 RepID=A0A914YRX8_9BILA